MSRSRSSVLPFLLATLLASSLVGCGNLGYYAQAVNGHFHVMRAARPIGDIVRDPASDPVLRKQLEEVQAIRDFASSELGLPDNNSYRNYADIQRPYVVWNVFAAPELSLKPRSWCMLMVGCVNYRGYYDKDAAEALAAELRHEAYDTYVVGVPAYSTLGYFDDPVLNTFLRHGTLEVARTVFHELAHQMTFVKDDSSFNESFATAVENEGLRRWSVHHAAPGKSAAFEAQRARKADFVRLMRDYRGKFQSLYATQRPVDQQRQAKADLFAALRRDYGELKAGWGGFQGYDRIVGAGFNNATLVSFSLYNQWVPAFEALLQRESHDLPRFYRQVAALAALDKEARCNALARLLPLTGTSEPSPDCAETGTKAKQQTLPATRASTAGTQIAVSPAPTFLGR